MGSLVVPSGMRNQSEAETLDLLLTLHFPNSEVKQELAAPAAALLARRPDWRLAAKVVNYRRVEWAKQSGREVTVHRPIGYHNLIWITYVRLGYMSSESVCAP